MPDFRLLIFYTVARRQNFTRAAEELFITQPAVTRHIRELEQHYKVQLFERNGTRIRLTSAGEILLQHAEEIFEIYRHLELELSSLREMHTGRLRLGASTTIAQYVLPPLLAAFHKKYKDVVVSLSTDNSEGIETALQKKQIDLGFIEGRSKNTALQYSLFGVDEIALLTRNGHPLTQKSTLKLSDVQKIPLLLRETGSGTRQVILHALKECGLILTNLNIEMELASTESIKSYLQHSNCAAFLSTASVQAELQSRMLVILPVKGLKIQRDFFYIQSKGEVSAIQDMFIRFCKSYNVRL